MVNIHDIFHTLWNTCNHEQKTFIKTPLRNMKLIGVPGAGKSTTIVTKI
jgi:superfamily I DNA/RNA helicase